MSSASVLGFTAQPQVENPADPSRPALSGPGAPPKVRPVIISPVTAPTLDAVRPNLPPPAASDLGVRQSAALLREGAFLSSQSARVVQGKSGRWYAIFDRDSAGRTPPPMILLQSSHLGAIDALAQRAGADGRLRLSGRVTVYRDRNYLLVTTPPLLERPQVVPASAPANSTPAPSPASSGSSPGESPKPATAGEPSIDQIVADLDRATGPRREVVRPQDQSGRPSSAGGDSSMSAGGLSATSDLPAQHTQTAGQQGFLSLRRARVVRATDGSLTATFDSGAMGKAEGPLTLLPNQNLASIESILDAQGESASFTLSGEVMYHAGRGYLLTSMYTVVKPSDNVFPTQ